MPRRPGGVALGYRPPFDWQGLTDFLGARAIPGVESVTATAYRRSIRHDAGAATIEVRPDRGRRLALAVVGDVPRDRSLVRRVRAMFDLDWDPRQLAVHFSADPILGAAAAACPGVRVPGAWDGFELAVRAVLGQQVSVRAATTLAGRIVQAWGSPFAGDDGVSRLFPTAAQLTDAAFERLGVMPARAVTLRELARAHASGRLDLNGRDDAATAIEMLLTLPGVGPWTASYIAMRALGDRDAFPSGDLVLRRAAGGCTARALEARSLAWRPWRAYAVMLMWRSAAAARVRAQRERARPSRATRDSGTSQSASAK